MGYLGREESGSHKTSEVDYTCAGPHPAKDLCLQSEDSADLLSMQVQPCYQGQARTSSSKERKGKDNNTLSLLVFPRDPGDQMAQL